MHRRALLLAVLPVLLLAFTAPVLAGPEITFERTEHDFGVISDTCTYRTGYKFTNTGDAPLLIEQIKASCACLQPSIARTRFTAGESGTIDLLLDPAGRTTSTTKTFMVFTNAGERPLRIRASYAVRPLLRLPYGPIDMGVIELGAGHRKPLTVRYTDRNLAVVSISTSSPHLEARMVPTEPGGPSEDGVRTAELVIEMKPDAPWGSLHDVNLVIDVRGVPAGGDEPIQYTYTKEIRGNVYGLIHATSLTYRSRITPRSVIELGPLAPGQGFQQSVQLNHVRSGRAWMIGAEPAPLAEGRTLIPDLVARSQPNGPTGYQVHVSGRAPSDIGPFVGEVIVRTAVPGEEELRVLVSGLVREGEITVQESSFRNMPR